MEVSDSSTANKHGRPLLFVTLQTEAWHGDVLSVVSRLKVWGVGFVLRLRNERHRLVLQVVPVQALEQGMTLELWWMLRQKWSECSSPIYIFIRCSAITFNANQNVPDCSNLKNPWSLIFIQTSEQNSHTSFKNLSLLQQYMILYHGVL